jgi:hypothetical protein
LPHTLSLGQVQWSISWSPAVSMFWWFAEHFSILQHCLTLDVAHWLKDDLFGLLPALFQAEAYRWLALGPSAFLAFISWKFTWRSSPCPSLCPSALTAFFPLCCVLVFSSLFIVQILFCFVLFCFLQGLWLVCLEGYAGFSQAWLRGIPHDTWCSPVGLPNVSQAVLEPVSGGVGALLFSQCNMAWRSFPRASRSGYWRFDSSWCSISTKCSSSISGIFLIYSAHAVCFCILVAILGPLFLNCFDYNLHGPVGSRDVSFLHNRIALPSLQPPELSSTK